MNTEVKRVTTTKLEVFTPVTENLKYEQAYPVRDKDNKKLDGSDLFAHFTANIIKEDLLFVR